MIQNYGRHRLQEDSYRGEKFKDWSCNVKGNNDMLSITQPKIIKDIYLAEIERVMDFLLAAVVLLTFCLLLLQQLERARRPP